MVVAEEVVVSMAQPLMGMSELDLILNCWRAGAPVPFWRQSFTSRALSIAGRARAC